MADNILADGVKYIEHIKAFNDLADDRWSDFDLSPLLVYMIDGVKPEALPYLAEQFDVTGNKGTRFAVTEPEKRALVKKAIELHRFKGTAWAIKEALKLIGVTDCRFIQYAGDFLYDGTYTHDGSQNYGDYNWAKFSVKIEAATFPTITTQIFNDIVALVNIYKPKSRILVSVIGFGILYDGQALHDDTYYYNTDEYFV
jgi:P2-related tail formation protein